MVGKIAQAQDELGIQEFCSSDYNTSMLAWPDDKQLARGEIFDRTVCFATRQSDASSRDDQCRTSQDSIRHGDDIELRRRAHVSIGDVRDLKGYEGKTTHAVFTNRLEPSLQPRVFPGQRKSWICVLHSFWKNTLHRSHLL